MSSRFGPAVTKKSVLPLPPRIQSSLSRFSLSCSLASSLHCSLCPVPQKKKASGHLKIVPFMSPFPREIPAFFQCSPYSQIQINNTGPLLTNPYLKSKFLGKQKTFFFPQTCVLFVFFELSQKPSPSQLTCCAVLYGGH